MKLEKANLIIEADNNYKDTLKYAQDLLTDYGNIPEASRLMLYCMYKLGQFDEIISSPYSDGDAVDKACKAIAMKELGKDGYEDALPKVDEEEYVTKWDKSYIYALIGQNDKCLSNLKGVVDSKEKDVNYIRFMYLKKTVCFKLPCNLR